VIWPLIRFTVELTLHNQVTVESIVLLLLLLSKSYTKYKYKKKTDRERQTDRQTDTGSQHVDR